MSSQRTPHPSAVGHPLARRQLLQAMAGLSSAWAMPSLWAQPATGDAKRGGRLVLVFLRGAYDGLSALVPHADAQYYGLRPSIAIPKPDGTLQTALALDSTFALHPALAPLMPLWKEGILGVVPAAGSADPTRSHFDAQHHWETGIPGKAGNSDGWMNGLAGLQARARNPSDGGAAVPRGNAVAVGVGEANPLILAGAATVQRVPKGQAATNQGALGNARTREAVMSLYAGQDSLSRTFREGAESRSQTAKTLAMDNPAEPDNAVMLAANNGAGPAQGLLLDAQHLGTLMRQNKRLKIGFLSAGGWDTHANQGQVTGALSNNLGNLAATLAQLRRDFSQPDDLVLVCSEFGRTCAENGTRGSDHGHGNALWLMGNQVNGGRWHGSWDGLASGNLHEGRDLPVRHDFRAVFAQALRANQGLTVGELDKLFPGFAWDKSLDGLMRA